MNLRWVRTCSVPTNPQLIPIPHRRGGVLSPFVNRVIAEPNFEIDGATLIETAAGNGLP